MSGKLEGKACVIYMFGYIIVNKAEMKYKEFDIYHAYYCGLCQVLKKKYGKLGQMSLSYDMTFLLMLLTELYEPEEHTGRCRCVAHPLEAHETRMNRLTEYIADMNVLFACYKCQDDWDDDKNIAHLLYGKMLEGKSRRGQEFYSQKAARLGQLMQAFSEAERRGETDIDVVAGLFGEVMAEIVAVRKDEWSDSLRRFGFFLGKFIYLMDAYEDVEADIRKRRYNPLKSQYEDPDFEEQCRTILTMMMSECCREFEKLPIVDNVGILRNILYSGVWCRYEVVKSGRVRKREEAGKARQAKQARKEMQKKRGTIKVR